MPKTKRKEVSPKRAPTRRQLDKWERQRRWQRIIVAASGFVIGAVLIFVGAGFYRDEIGPRFQPVLRVDDTVYNLGYFTSMLAVYARGQDPSFAASVSSLVIQDMQNSHIMKSAAADLGITVDPKDVNDTLERLKLPANQEHRDLVSGQLLATKLRGDYFGLQVATSADQVQVQAMALDSRKAALEIRARLEKGEDFVAVAKEVSLAGLTKENGGNYGWLNKEFGFGFEGAAAVLDAAFNMDKGALSQPIFDKTEKNGGYWIIQVTSIDADTQQRLVKAILLGTAEEAAEVRARIVAGEDFAKLAREFSQHEVSKDQGGDLGPLPPSMSSAFKDVAMKLKAGEASEPVADSSERTEGAYWLVKVLDKEKGRKLDDDARNRLIDEAFNKWMKDVSAKHTIENYLDPEKVQWAVSHLPKPPKAK